MVEHATFELVCLNYDVLHTAVSAVVDVTEDSFTELLNDRFLDTSVYGIAFCLLSFTLQAFEVDSIQAVHTLGSYETGQAC